MNKWFSIIGLSLFLFGLSLFSLSLLGSEHRLSETVLQERIPSPYHRQAILQAAPDLLNQTKNSNIAFVSALKTALHKAKQQQDELAVVVDWKATKLPEGVAEWDFRLGDWQIDDYLFKLTKYSTVGWLPEATAWLFWLSFGLGSLGVLIYLIPLARSLPGIKHNGIFQHSATHRGWLGWATGLYLIGFYVLLYWFPYYITNWTLLVDPISRALNGGDASHWFLYGFLYCLCMVVMGIRMALKYRHNRYQLVRTGSVVFFQLGFAFLLPELLMSLNNPYMDLKNAFPLDYDFFAPSEINKMVGQGQAFMGTTVGTMMFVWGIVLTLVVVPLFTYWYGKRWYCSWVCGCGGLAETLGDPYRQLSDKSVKAWKVERYLIYGILVFILFVTFLLLWQYFTGNAQFLIFNADQFKGWYGFFIGSIFSGIVGTGFYPLMGNRVWCRFGCPLAALMGIVQKFKSRFRITTNGGQCISCGNCSVYCEMGIDVRWYAQRGQDIVRASCVGCGVCSAVCPRGVLRLENGDDVAERASVERVLQLSKDGVRLQL
jgi:polyferredoxin